MTIGTGNGEGSSTAAIVGGSSGGDGGGMLKKGPWTASEDAQLTEYVKLYGEGNWNAVQKHSGLLRCGKSCRLRWANHLRKGLKKGSFTPAEERQIVELHFAFGNKWARMATQLHGRTDNEIKNYWNTRIKRRQRQGLPLYPPDLQQQKEWNDYQQNQTRQSPMTHSTENTTQFGGNPTSFSWLDPLPINFSPTQSIPAVAPPMGHSHLNQHCEPQPLFPIQQQLKRTRFDDFEFPTTFNATSISSMVPTTHHQSSYGSNYMSLQQHHHRQQQQQQQQQNCSPFSMSMELPSNQYLPAPASECDDSWELNNSGLLGSVLQNTHTDPNPYIAVHDLPMETIPPKSMFEGQSIWKDTVEDLSHADVKPMIPIHGCTAGRFSGAINPKIEPLENPLPDNEGLMAVVAANMPSNGTSTAPNNMKKESGEISNEPSSAVTDDDFGIDIQKIFCFTFVGEAAEPDSHHHCDPWGGGHWDNMPGIC